ncbi:hypothetical protein A0H81_00279 [Grifola frondosa]|uniref:Uncharacterized protein n=1 Tax=Grifola frondosa TaxID=5627 RepID=A0A1C7MPJ2_GRIFR|nr:hypothetical protein A0H81_00279 [Grifola frondosa]
MPRPEFTAPFPLHRSGPHRQSTFAAPSVLLTPLWKHCEVDTAWDDTVLHCLLLFSLINWPTQLDSCLTLELPLAVCNSNHIMGSIFSAIGNAINAIISAIAGIIMTIVDVIVMIIVTIFDVIFDILCCNCFGGRSRRTGSHRMRSRF